tara:strand:+ start:173 stop:427 length:255 start_codon:yes stop_codon:yes gene_type:complete
MTAFFLIMILFGNMCLLIALIMHVEEKGSVRKKPTKKRKVTTKKKEDDWEMISDEDFDQITNTHILDFMEEERYESKSRNKKES